MQQALGFVSGGTVQAGRGIYIPRQADRELYDLCMEGEYGFVMAARQRGKSSLMTNVTEELKKRNVHVGIVDISMFGETNEPDEWYATILEIIGEKLGLRLDVLLWWEQQASAYPLTARRFTIFFQQVVLAQLEGQVVIFIDEIDKTLSLKFTDDFFMAIRAMYNQRSEEESFHRLSFVLLGVTTPTELIKTKTSTPYNIGKQIELADFNLQQMQPFENALAQRLGFSPESARIVVQLIFYWTDGHPYLSQRLLKEIEQTYQKAGSPTDLKRFVDELVRNIFLKARNEISDSNLAEVKRQLDFGRLKKRNHLDVIAELYYKILVLPQVIDDDEDMDARIHLKLAGIIKNRDGFLEIRNRIYENIFDNNWFAEQYAKHAARPLDDLHQKILPPSPPSPPSTDATYSQRLNPLEAFRQAPSSFGNDDESDNLPEITLGSSEADNIVKKAIDAYRANDKSKARELLLKAVDVDERHEQAWLSLSMVLDNVNEQQISLENVLSINPNNDFAKNKLAALKEENKKNTTSLPPKLSTTPFSTPSDDPWGSVTAKSPFDTPPNPWGTPSKTTTGIVAAVTDTNDPWGVAPDSSVTLPKPADQNPFTSTNPITDPFAVRRPPAPKPTTPEPANHLSNMRRQRRPAAATAGSHTDIKVRVQTKLLSELDPSMNAASPEFRSTVEELFSTILSEENIVMSRAERNSLFDAIIAEILGFGPLEPLLADATVSEIMVNGPKNVYVLQKGNITRAPITFQNDDHLERVIRRITDPVGKFITPKSPYVQTQLPDGSSVTAILRPLSLSGPSLYIRKIVKKPLTIEDVVRFGWVTPEMAEFLRACAIAKINLLFVGVATTSLMTVIGNFIPSNRRIITVETQPTLQLMLEHVLSLLPRAANIEGQGEVTMSKMIAYAATLVADHLLIDPVTEQEVAGYIEQAAQNCTWATLKAKSIPNALYTLERGLLKAIPNANISAVRDWIAQSLDLVICIKNLRDGRIAIDIAEVVAQAPGEYALQPLFEFEQLGVEAGQVIGRTKPTGHRPTFEEHLEAAGIHLPPSVYGIGASRF